MRVRQIRRCLFLAFLVQEGVVFLRATPDERAHAPVPPFPALFGLALLAPLVLASAVPRWLERLVLFLFLQVAGWALEAAAMTQLVREQSFGIHPTAATKPLQTGLYRFEHPIYLGLLVSIAGWTLPVPPCLVAVVLTYRGFRHAVGQERASGIVSGAASWYREFSMVRLRGISGDNARPARSPRLGCRSDRGIS